MDQAESLDLMKEGSAFLCLVLKNKDGRLCIARPFSNNIYYALGWI